MGRPVYTSLNLSRSSYYYEPTEAEDAIEPKPLELSEKYKH